MAWYRGTGDLTKARERFVHLVDTRAHSRSVDRSRRRDYINLCLTRVNHVSLRGGSSQLHVLTDGLASMAAEFHFHRKFPDVPLGA